MKPKARRKSRVFAMQALYQWLMSGNNPVEVESQILEEADLSKFDVDYFRQLFMGVVKNVDALDEAMTPYLDRSVAELTPIELSILRLAVYELTYSLDVPYRVVINEALELTKQFGAADGFKYVNGVLDKVAKAIRSSEMT